MRLSVTWESSFHLRHQQLCETTLQDVHIISSPHLYLLPRWVRYVPEVNRSGPRGIPPFFLALSIPRHSTTGNFHPLQHFNIIRTTCIDVSPSTAAHLMDLRAMCSTPGTIGRGPVAIPAWRYGFYHSSAFIGWRDNSSYCWSDTGTTTKYRDLVA